jgi:hypothetical protein
MHPWLIVFILLTTLISPATAAQTPAAIEISQAAAFYEYGEKVVFQAQIEPVENVKHVFLFIQSAGQSTRIEPFELDETGGAIHEYDARQFPLRPFARTHFWYRVILTDDSEFTSEKYSFDYIDNRFEWQNLQNDRFSIHWYSGDLVFGQEILDVSETGLQSAYKYLPVENSYPIHLRVRFRRDLQKALQLTSQAWIAGHASPDLGVILISIPNGMQQRIELERQLPHELVHLMQYQVVKEAYHSMPVWLLEGMASLAELHPNPEYERVLQKAIDDQALQPIETLCAAFPREASGAFLSYAQSASFVRFLHQKYGTSGLKNLMLQYQDGLGCSEGAQAALGSSLQQLENQWHMEACESTSRPWPGRTWRPTSSSCSWPCFLRLPQPYLLVARVVNHTKPGQTGFCYWGYLDESE